MVAEDLSRKNERLTRRRSVQVFKNEEKTQQKSETDVRWWKNIRAQDSPESEGCRPI